MKHLTTFLTIISLNVSTNAEPNYRKEVFTHTTAIARQLSEKSTFSIRGRSAGLWLLMSVDSKSTFGFPRNKSFAVDPSGKRIKLLHTPPSGSSFHSLSFRDAHSLVRGIYTYHIFITYNDIEHHFVHHIDYSYTAATTQLFSQHPKQIQKN